MTTLVYMIDVPSFENAVRVARELEENAGIVPVVMRESGQSYRYDADQATELIDADITEAEYLINNSL